MMTSVRRHPRAAPTLTRADYRGRSELVSGGIRLRIRVPWRALAGDVVQSPSTALALFVIGSVPHKTLIPFLRVPDETLSSFHLRILGNT
jgi:hypothetical protein